MASKSAPSWISFSQLFRPRRLCLQAADRLRRSAILTRWLVLGLDRLALAGVMCTIFLLGYWRPYSIATIPRTSVTPEQYALVSLYHLEYQQISLYPSDFSMLVTVALWLLAWLMKRVIRHPGEAVQAASGGAPLPPPRLSRLCSRLRPSARTFTASRIHLGSATLALPMAGLALLAALSATQAILPPVSLDVAAHLLLTLGFILAVLKLRPPMWAIIGPLALLLVIEGVLSLLQEQAQSTLWSLFLLHWKQNATAAQSGASVIELPDGLRWLRAYGSLPHPNLLGGLLCQALPLIAGAYLRPSRRGIISWLLLAALAAGFLALLLSFSRAAWLGMLAAALWAGLLFRRNRRPHHPDDMQSPKRSSFYRQLFLPVLLAIGLLVGLIAALGPALQARLLVTSPLEDQSISQRIVLIEASAVFIGQHPWLGIGAGNMSMAEFSYPPTQAIAQPVHNVPLLIAVETGLPGLLLWLIPPIAALWGLWHSQRPLPPGMLAASASLVALLAVAQLDHYLWSQPPAQLLYWLTLALIVGLKEQQSGATSA